MPSMAPKERESKRQKLSPPNGQVVPANFAASPPTSAPNEQNNDTLSNRSSWYGRTWPRNAAPVTQVARESIASASDTAVETASIVKDKVIGSNASASSRKSSLALTLGHTASYKSQPLEAVSTRDHAMPQGRRQSIAAASQPELSTAPQEPLADPSSSISAQPTTTSAQVKSKGTNQQEDVSKDSAPRSWIGWLAGGDGVSAKQDSASSSQVKGKDTSPSESASQKNQDGVKPPVENSKATSQTVTEPTTEPPSKVSAEIQRRSWLPIWNNAAASQSAPAITSPKESSERQQQPSSSGKAVENATATPDTSKVDVNEQKPNATSNTQTVVANRSSGWSFWSREKNSETGSTKSVPEEGEAVVGNNTAEQPDKLTAGISKEPEPKKPNSIASADAAVINATKKKQKSKSGSKDLRQVALENDSTTTKVENKAASATAMAPKEAELSRTSSPVSASARKQYEHLLLPSLHDTLKLPENPTFLQQLAKLFYSVKDPELKHLNLVKDPPRIKNALVIGVHGYFPAPLIQSVLGRPTGTSIKFADMAAKSIKRYTRAQGYDCSVKTAALEGEGKIAERIDLLWKLLLNWIDDIRKADFVFIASHSQGVPVAIMLLAKLIHFGCISGARVGVCAMAGVNMGPFPEYKSRWISGSSAGELFEFADSNSKVSKDYLAALDDVLKFGTRLSYIGSIDDQLVSMESSIFAPVSHPHIFRAVSIDSRLHAPDFVSHLVALVLKLRNLGIHDHGLIRELSTPLAGSLYTGEGHSRLYEDSAIYDLALSFALETTSMPGTPMVRRDIDSAGTNPYILPFAMRGILEEDFVRSELQSEASQLLNQFDDWKPQTKALKDVKFRLEGIRSKL